MSKKTLNKCDELIERLKELKKAVEHISTVGSKQAPSGRVPVPMLGAGWSQDPGTGTFHHSTVGMISTTPNSKGSYDIGHRHDQGYSAVGQVKNMNEAGAKIRSYINNLPKNAGMKPTNVVPTAKNEDSKPKRTKGLTSAQLAAEEEAEHFKKNYESKPWVTHASVPNAEQEMAKLKKTNPIEVAEDMMATQLANLMAGKAMLNNPPKQPTDEEMFGHLIPSEEQVEKAQQSWGGAINNWLAEAQKPISSRFASQEEEEAYWASIKVVDRDDGKSGF